MMPRALSRLGIVLTLTTGSLGGCATLSPAHPIAAPSVTKTDIAPQGDALLERDLTIDWMSRRYWTVKHPVTRQKFLAQHTLSVSTSQGGTTRSLQVRRLSAHSHPTLPRRQTAPRNVLTRPSTPAPTHNALPVEPLPPGLSYRIWFAPETEILGPDGIARVKRFSATLKQHPIKKGQTVWLRGYILHDETPPSRERFAVGRAVSVRNALRREGVPLTTPVRIHHPKLHESGRYVEVHVQ